MATPPPGKKKKPAAVGIELLLGEDEPAGDEMGEDDEEMDLADEDIEDEALAEGEDLGQEMAEEDSLEDEEEPAPTVDPEHAALAEKLGFADPEQQQALVDLIQLVLSSDSGGAPAEKESGALPPLPESIY